MAVTCLGDAAELSFPATGVFRRRESEVAHQLLRVVEPGDVAEFGDQRRCGDELDASEGLAS